jgi:glucose/arabinose dehydrogenase
VRSISFLVLTLFLFATLLGTAESAFGSAKDVQLDKLHLPPGFHIELFAEVPGARSMCLSPKGTLFVGTRESPGSVYAVSAGSDPKQRKVYEIAKGLYMPNGVDLLNGSLFVGAVNRILRFDDIESHLANPPAPVVVSSGFPSDAHHGWKYIRFGPDGWLYVPVGANCNVCLRDDTRYASIMRMKPDGSHLELFASGIRNTVGFDWDPKTNELWFTDNGRDWLGDNLPPDELNHAPTNGLHFGFPFRYGNSVADPEWGNKAPPGLKFTAPVQCLDPHVATLGMRFYRGKMFPAEYRNQVFIAEHGSWNRTSPIGYRITLVTLKNGQSTGYKPFIDGWLQKAALGANAWGRPVDLCEMPDGSMLISDDKNGVIYRVSYSGPSQP